MQKKLLVVDDEALIVKGLKFSLEQDGYFVDTAFDGNEALEKINKTKFDLVILDVMLPEVDGFEVLRRIREKELLPVIMLTAKVDDMDKILGFEYGADDYLTKPFNILELKARVKALFRRSTPVDSIKGNTLTAKDMVINISNRSATIEGVDAELTAKEYDLLYLFATNPGKVFSRESLLEAIWKYDYMGDLRTVDVHIRRLREKIEKNPSQPEYVFTKWGVGYYFTDK